MFQSLFSRFGARNAESAPFGAIIDASNDTLIAITQHMPTLYFIDETIMDTIHVPHIPLSPELEAIIKAKPSTYPEWTWDNGRAVFKKTDPRIVTDYMRERSVLSAKKAWAIRIIITWVNGFRAKIDTGLLFQNEIYAEKERQARLLKDANFDESLSASCPLVADYAEDESISLQQAADEILLQAQLDRDFLARSERFRLPLFKKIRLAKTPGEIDDIVRGFRKNRAIV